MSFLKAEWRKLAIANYVVDPQVLGPYLPAGTELDLWNGKCYVSLVGFMFLNTRLLGLPIPFHQNFEEVNLRFYVRHLDGAEWKRGVVFIKEIVPKRALSFVANTIYSEHYDTMKMSHNWSKNDYTQIVEYKWHLKDYENSFEVEAELDGFDLIEGSEEEFITEHYWGYTKVNDRKTFEYEVTHPKWKIYKVLNNKIKVDFGAVYGREFSNLGKPSSIMLAEGSEITVENKRQIS